GGEARLERVVDWPIALCDPVSVDVHLGVGPGAPGGASRDLDPRDQHYFSPRPTPAPPASAAGSPGARSGSVTHDTSCHDGSRLGRLKTRMLRCCCGP